MNENQEEPKNEPVLQFEDGGIVCDNESCDYEAMGVTFEQYPEWVNKPCPKCGDNLLTEEDYQDAVDFRATIEAINSFGAGELEQIGQQILAENPDALKELANSDMFKDTEGLEKIMPDENGEFAKEEVSITIKGHNGLKATKIEDRKESE